jgi:hypothetical protein
MERTSGMKKGLRQVATVVFLAAALASTGCNTLMGPSSSTTDTAQNSNVVAGNAGNNVKPAGNNVKP